MNRWIAIVYHLCRLGLGGLFVYAGLIKAEDTVGFARSVANYKILPYGWNYLVAASLPYVEFLAGLLLVLNRKVRPAVLVLGVLNLVFIMALVSVLVRGLDIDCGCFDTSGEGHTTAQWALFRDIGIMLLIVATYRLRSWLVSEKQG